VAALPGGAIELDGSRVERVDTAALQLLVLLRRALDGRGGTLAWRGASDTHAARTQRPYRGSSPWR